MKTLLSVIGFERSDLKTLHFNVDTEYESYTEKNSCFIIYLFLAGAHCAPLRCFSPYIIQSSAKNDRPEPSPWRTSVCRYRGVTPTCRRGEHCSSGIRNECNLPQTNPTGVRRRTQFRRRTRLDRPAGRLFADGEPDGTMTAPTGDGGRPMTAPTKSAEQYFAALNKRRTGIRKRKPRRRCVRAFALRLSNIQSVNHSKG